jgi:hypothetical protein
MLLMQCWKCSTAERVVLVLFLHLYSFPAEADPLAALCPRHLIYLCHCGH